MDEWQCYERSNRIAASNSKLTMKINLLQKRFLSTAGAFAAVVIGGVTANVAAAPFDSPVGDWDFSFGGSQKGVAQITFLGDNTLTGFEILTPGKPLKSGVVPDVNPRGGPSTDADPRTGGQDGSGTNTYVWGGVLIDGYWGFNEKGKIVGAVTFTSASSTNGMSFVGTVTTGTRMTLRASDDTGGMVYRGVPRAALADISGTYTAVGKKGRARHTGFLTLSPSGDPNIYDVETHGPGYDGTGFALLTSNNKIGVYYEIGDTNPVIVSMTGSFKPTKLKGTISGTDGTNNFSLKIVQP